jgi:opacity protein-like surface antigen
MRRTFFFTTWLYISIFIFSFNQLYSQEDESDRFYSVGFFSGPAIPFQEFNKNFNAGYSSGLNFDCYFTEQLCAVAFIAYNYFYAGSASTNDTYWWNISLNVKYKFTSDPLSPYLDGGLGVYIPKERSTKLGTNVGLGLEYSISTNWLICLGADYHFIFSDIRDIEFGTTEDSGFVVNSDIQIFVPHLGLSFRF